MGKIKSCCRGKSRHMIKETEEQARERRKSLYGCDGLCYGGIDEKGQVCQICGGIDTCEETRGKEAIAEFIAVLVILITSVMLIVCFMLLVIAYMKGFL